ncbi:MAG: hypothetical protein NVV74_05060 [Magnetospirillum sp.]|nr:hypothetical protein [Magnetospirillum sp.]
MSAIMADWRAKKAREDEELHERLRAAVAARQMEIYTDQRMLDFQGSPVHNGWDHLAPLLVLMSLALAILLATGVAIGIVAMTLGALGHLLGIKHFVAWRIRARAKAYMLESAAHLQHLWELGGIALVMVGSNEPPCLAPRGDWRKFIRRNLPAEGVPMAPAPETDEPPSSDQEILPP